MNDIRIRQTLVLKIPFDRIRAAALSFDHDRLHLCKGIDLVTRDRGYPVEALRAPQEHLAELRRSGEIGDGPVLTQTWRNLVQNLRCPAYTRERGPCESSDEQTGRSQRPYHGIARTADGDLRAVALDFRLPVPDDILWYASGIPVLWDGKLAGLDELLPEVCDHCHLWRLSTARGPPRREDDVVKFQSLDRAFRALLHQTPKEAADGMRREAERLQLAREELYLHNLCGLGDGHLVIVVAHGSLQRVAEIAAAAGARHAVVVDNGGSCQVALRRGGVLRPLVECHYFREPTIALAAYEIDTDESWLPFAADATV